VRCSVVLSLLVVVHAQDATWALNPTVDFNTDANWTTAAVPTGTAIFGASNVTAVTISANTSVGSLQFNAGAPAYSFTLLNGGPNFSSLAITGAGIVNNSGNIPTFNINLTHFGDPGLLFMGASTAANALLVNNEGRIAFADTSTAAILTLIVVPIVLVKAVWVLLALFPGVMYAIARLPLVLSRAAGVCLYRACACLSNYPDSA
jgi:hypothetical protein